MSTDIILALLLIWSVAGLLAAIAFGKSIQETTPDEERELASSNGMVKYFRKSKSKRRDTSAIGRASDQSTKRASS